MFTAYRQPPEFSGFITKIREDLKIMNMLYPIEYGIKKLEEMTKLGNYKAGDLMVI
jgi:hypothetical protein